MSEPPSIGPRSANLTELLRKWGHGDAKALDSLVPLVDRELRRIARRYLRNERGSPTLDRTTALINETYACFLRRESIPWESRLHFFGIAARLMRQILVDHARRRRALKRGRGEEIGLGDERPGGPMKSEGLGPAELITVHQALERLADLDPRQARIVELRFFGGLTIEETAEALRVSIDTVKRDWRNARLWLRREMGGNDNDDS